MLMELRIKDFAIIDQLEIHFKPGLVLFTGETGAGKSIIIDAVETLLGGRAEASMIRSGAARANIEALIQISHEVRANVHEILQREDLLDDLNYLTIGREIRTNGRNIARVNGRNVNVSLLRELGEHLVDVHGQSEHLSLLRVREHVGLLDRYADTAELQRAYSETYRQLIAVRRELNDLRQTESEAARLSDLLAYQINEIESARLKPGEEEDLRAERNRLANAEGLTSLVQEALVALDEGVPDSPSVIEMFGRVVDSIQGLAKLDSSRTELEEQALNLSETLTNMVRELRLYSEGIEFNPKRLDQVEERLNLIHLLKRKYGNSIPSILAFAENANKQLDTITHAGERIIILESQESELLSELGTRGQALSKQRHSAAGQLQSVVESELDELRMPDTQFNVDFRTRPDPEGAPLDDGRRVAFDSSGLDQVEFLIAPNPGEGLKPLVKIASGGETSRLMLALKNVLARADHVPALIFDEIDQGIGGRVGAIVGEKLWRLARLHQVLCITHLPQLAAFAVQHFQVSKHTQGGRTITEVEDLRGEARIQELAQMLGEISPGTLNTAREMLYSTEKLNEQELA